MEEGEEVFIPEDIKMEVLNRMFNSIQRRTQLHDTRVFPAELADEFIDSPFLSELVVVQAQFAAYVTFSLGWAV